MKDNFFTLSMTPSVLTSPELAELQWHQLSGEAFDAAISGAYDDAGWCVAPAWLAPPKLKYYLPRSALSSRKDTRHFFMATLPEPSGRRREAVALLEIEAQYSEPSCVGLKYVTVREDLRRQGLAMRLYEMLIEHLKQHGLRLYRTRPGAQTPAEFTAAVTRLLQQHGANWYSRDSLSA